MKKKKPILPLDEKTFAKLERERRKLRQNVLAVRDNFHKVEHQIHRSEAKFEQIHQDIRDEQSHIES
jgi:septal ring factor EnvC (AmiA/AmiB activator)